MPMVINEVHQFHFKNLCKKYLPSIFVNIPCPLTLKKPTVESVQEIYLYSLSAERDIGLIPLSPMPGLNPGHWCLPETTPQLGQPGTGMLLPPAAATSSLKLV